MAKDKKKVESQFNREDYDYLDKATLHDWIVEFLKRNKVFMEDYAKFLSMTASGEKLPYIDELFKKYKVQVVLPVDKQDVNPTKPSFILPDIIKAYRIYEREEDDRYGSIDEVSEFIEKYTAENIEWILHGRAGLHYKDKEDIMAALFGVPDQDNTYPCSDTLVLAVNINGRKEDILDTIDKILSIHKQQGPRRRFNKWKYYLIVYDLRKKGLTFSQITDELLKAYPDDKSLFDETNINNYYEKISTLINGGYKKYI